MISQTQSRLNTGLKVSSTADDTSMYFKAKTLNDRESAVMSDKSTIDQGISVVKTALDGMSNVKTILQQAEDLAKSALTSNKDTRKELAAQFDNLRNQIDSVASNSYSQGVNLLKDGSSYSVQLSSSSVAKLDIKGSDLSSNGLGVRAASDDWSSNDDIKAALTDLVGSGEADREVNAAASDLQTSASSTSTTGAETSSTTSSAVAATATDTMTTDTGALHAVSYASATMTSNLTMLKTRSDITSNYSNSLQTSASNLSMGALDNEEVSPLALQTRQMIGTQSLSFAGEQEQALIQLFH